MGMKDWTKMKDGAHTLKSASGYVGAGKIHYACYYIQKAHHENNFTEMQIHYPLIVEASIEFKRFS